MSSVYLYIHLQTISPFNVYTLDHSSLLSQDGKNKKKVA